jgi:hypothetical protein
MARRQFSTFPRIIIGLVVVCLLGGGVMGEAVVAQSPTPGVTEEPAPSPTPQSSPTPESLFVFQECEEVDEATLRDELNRITQEVFASGQSGLEISALVDAQWLLLGIDGVIDSQIDLAVERVASEEDYWSRVVSGWSADKAEEFTTKVATYAFDSEPFRAAIEQLSVGVADGLTADMEIMSARSASSALLCVQEFIGKTYSETMVGLFVEDVQTGVAAADLTDVDAGINPILDSRTKTLAGIGIIIGAQIAKRLAKAIAKRVAGKVAGRLLGRAATTVIPLAGWIIGGGLLVWDLVEAGNGSLPQIQIALKGPDVKAGIRTEISDAVGVEMAAALPEMARTVSNEIYSQWLDFRRKHNRVLALAGENDRFRTILDGADVGDVGRLGDLVAFYDQTMDQATLDQDISNRQLERLLYLPDSAMTLLQATASPASVVAWAELAGDRIDQVVATELFQLAQPADFADRDALDRVLALEDPAAIAQIMLLSTPDRVTLLQLPPAQGRTLAAAYSVDDLTWLASYVTALAPQQRAQLVDRILREPALMPRLKFEDIRKALLETDNMPESLTFLVPEPTAQSPMEQVTGVIEDTSQVLNGDVPWRLFLRKYVTLRNGLILLGALIGLWLLIRLLFRRNQGVNVTINMPDTDKKN